MRLLVVVGLICLVVFLLIAGVVSLLPRWVQWVLAIAAGAWEIWDFYFRPRPFRKKWNP